MYYAIYQDKKEVANAIDRLEGVENLIHLLFSRVPALEHMYSDKVHGIINACKELSSDAKCCVNQRCSGVNGYNEGLGAIKGDWSTLKQTASADWGTVAARWGVFEDDMRELNLLHGKFNQCWMRTQFDFAELKEVWAKMKSEVSADWRHVRDDARDFSSQIRQDWGHLRDDARDFSSQIRQDWGHLRDDARAFSPQVKQDWGRVRDDARAFAPQVRQDWGALKQISHQDWAAVAYTWEKFEEGLRQLNELNRAFNQCWMKAQYDFSQLKEGWATMKSEVHSDWGQLKEDSKDFASEIKKTLVKNGFHPDAKNVCGGGVKSKKKCHV